MSCVFNSSPACNRMDCLSHDKSPPKSFIAIKHSTIYISNIIMTLCACKDTVLYVSEKLKNQNTQTGAFPSDKE